MMMENKNIMICSTQTCGLFLRPYKQHNADIILLAILCSWCCNGILLFRGASGGRTAADEAQRNLQAVLDNYQDSPDTTYEYGDRRCIADAAKNATLNNQQLTDALQRWKETEGHLNTG